MRATLLGERWFVSRLSSNEESKRTVLAGTDFANSIVGVFDTPEEAEAAVREHNAALNEIGPAEGATSTPGLDHKQSGEKPMTEGQEYIACRLPATPDIATDVDHLRELIDLTRDIAVNGLHDANGVTYTISQKNGDRLISLLTVAEAHAGRVLQRADRRA